LSLVGWKRLSADLARGRVASMLYGSASWCDYGATIGKELCGYAYTKARVLLFIVWVEEGWLTDWWRVVIRWCWNAVAWSRPMRSLSQRVAIHSLMWGWTYTRWCTFVYTFNIINRSQYGRIANMSQDMQK
jgi:hypothetical protein